MDKTTFGLACTIIGTGVAVATVMFLLVDGLRDDMREDFRTVREDMREDFGTVRENFGTVRENFGTVRENFATVREDFRTVRQDIKELRQDVADVRDRVARMEGLLTSRTNTALNPSIADNGIADQ